MDQMSMLSRARVDWSNDVVIRLPRDSDREYARLGSDWRTCVSSPGWILFLE